MYLHHILTRSDDALIKRVFLAQLHDTGKGDWCSVVREDLNTLGLEHLTFEEISEKSKESMRTLINDQVKLKAFLDLEQEKLKLNKIAELSYTKLEMQSYFSDKQIPTRLKQLAFRWRTKMIKVGWNYGNKRKCPICQVGDDTQNHLFKCKELNESHSRGSIHDSLMAENQVHHD